MTSVGQISVLSPGVLTSGAKIGVLLAIVVFTFLSALAFGLGADGHNLYSPDHRTWREAVETLMEPTLGLGGLAMWLFAVFGGRKNYAAQYVLGRAAFAALASILLMQVELFSTPLIAFVLGGSVAAICFAGRHSWAALFIASAPYLACILAVFAYFVLAPPDTGPIGP
jgi:hypothetical protein